TDVSSAILELLEHADKSDADLLALGRDKEKTHGYARTLQIDAAGSQTVAIRTPDWAFLSPLNTGCTVAELYRKPDDRWETNNVVQHYPDLVPGLEAHTRAGPER